MRKCKELTVFRNMGGLGRNFLKNRVLKLHIPQFLEQPGFGNFLKNTKNINNHDLKKTLTFESSFILFLSSFKNREVMPKSREVMPRSREVMPRYTVKLGKQEVMPRNREFMPRNREVMPRYAQKQESYAEKARRYAEKQESYAEKTGSYAEKQEIYAESQGSYAEQICPIISESCYTYC